MLLSDVNVRVYITVISVYHIFGDANDFSMLSKIWTNINIVNGMLEYF